MDRITEVSRIMLEIFLGAVGFSPTRGKKSLSLRDRNTFRALLFHNVRRKHENHFKLRPLRRSKHEFSTFSRDKLFRSNRVRISIANMRILRSASCSDSRALGRPAPFVDGKERPFEPFINGGGRWESRLFLRLSHFSETSETEWANGTSIWNSRSKVRRRSVLEIDVMSARTGQDTGLLCLPRFTTRKS